MTSHLKDDKSSLICLFNTYIDSYLPFQTVIQLLRDCY